MPMLGLEAGTRSLAEFSVLVFSVPRSAFRDPSLGVDEGRRVRCTLTISTMNATVTGKGTPMTTSFEVKEDYVRCAL
jgi:hypothetical protein